MNLGKLPPQAVELEEAVLGALMLEKDAINAVIDILSEESFYKDAHRLIFKSIINLFRDSEPVDLLTVTSELRKSGDLEKAGGAFYITELTSQVSSSANIEYHSKIIQEQHLKREMIKIGSLMQQKSFEDTTDVFELMDSIQVSLLGLMGGISSNKSIKLKDSISDVFQQMKLDMTKKQNNEITGIPTPITKLNQFTGGWRNGDLIILAARPAMGKTALALDFAIAAAKEKRKVAFFSLEMVHQSLTYRIIAKETKVRSVQEMQRGDLNSDQYFKMDGKVNSLRALDITFDDEGNLSLMGIRAKANKIKMLEGIDMIVVDYLQLMADQVKGSNREQEISRISRALKVLAKELNIPVIALSQLSRAVETRGGNKKPILSDLRESGSIEQDADMVIFLYRPEYYGISEMEFDDIGVVDTKGLALGDIAKHRNGSLGEFRMNFDGRHVHFSDWDIPIPQKDDIDWSRVEKNF